MKTVFHKTHGKGELISEDEKYYTVSFNGVEKTLLKAFTTFTEEKEIEKTAAKKLQKTATKNKVETKTAKDIFNAIVGSREDRHSCWEMIVNTSSIMKKADEVGHFASKIVEDAMSGKFVSEKQAWAVAFFAQKHNLINS